MPPRSILFAAVTAEEQGLLGSEYLGKHVATLPVTPILDMNFDDLPPIGIPEDVEVSGAERTTFYPAVEKIAKEFNLTIRPDALPEAEHYYRSDHFSLSRVGIPAFSVGEGRKFEGRDLAWGVAQAKDYVDNRYHKPSDVFQEDWNFAGLAKMVQFGYALGKAAATQPGAIDWLPGDEFEKARQKSQAQSSDAKGLFAGHPELCLVEFVPLVYPPLARQTRIGGTVIAQVSVADDGTVTGVKTTGGHDIIRPSVEETIKKWKFEPGDERSFELKCEFVLAGTDDSLPDFFVAGPLRVRISAPGVVLNPASARPRS